MVQWQEFVNRVVNEHFQIVLTCDRYSKYKTIQFPMKVLIINPIFCDRERWQDDLFLAWIGLDDERIDWDILLSQAVDYSLQDPPVLSQQVLLSLLQQLGYDLSRDCPTKLAWIRDAALALDPQVCWGLGEWIKILCDLLKGVERMHSSDCRLTSWLAPKTFVCSKVLARSQTWDLWFILSLKLCLCSKFNGCVCRHGIGPYITLSCCSCWSHVLCKSGDIE